MAMAALPGEASCPICREFFRDPVSIHCGHHFCRACIERRWEWPTGGFTCPRCQDAAPERSLRPSRELERVLEIARRLSRGEALGLAEEEEEEEEGEEEEEEGCRRHREPLELFCREDAAALCAICRESRAHRTHTVLPLPEAARHYKEQIQARLQTLKEDRDKLLELREAEMRRIREYLEEAEAERRRILSHSRELLLALEELSRLRLARLRRLERDIGSAHEETATNLTREISRLEARAQELEEKCEQPARTFLQDLSGTLSSLGQEKPPRPPPPLLELGRRIQRFREENLPLEEALGRIRDLLVFELPEKMPVTLDPRTAHPQLRVAPDGSSVSWEPNRDRPEPEPGPEPGAEPGAEPGPEPEPGAELGAEPGPKLGLEPEPGAELGAEPGAEPEPEPGAEPGPDPSVLGREGVTAGQRCWDVRVAPEGSWALGVALETPGSGEGTPESGAGTLGSGAETPGNGAGTLGSGTGTLGNGAETPESGAGTLGSGEGTLGSEAETPGTGTETLGNGTGTPGNGAETPKSGAETPGIGTGTPRTGSETPGNGAGTPGTGSRTAGSPGWELWSMGLCQGQFWALTSRERIPLFPARAPGTVRVALDYERGQVAFFDADRRSLIFAFPAAAFEGRKARPWFLVWGEGSRLALCP